MLHVSETCKKRFQGSKVSVKPTQGPLWWSSRVSAPLAAHHGDGREPREGKASARRDRRPNCCPGALRARACPDLPHLDATAGDARSHGLRAPESRGGICYAAILGLGSLQFVCTLPVSPLSCRDACMVSCGQECLQAAPNVHGLDLVQNALSSSSTGNSCRDHILLEKLMQKVITNPELHRCFGALSGCTM